MDRREALRLSSILLGGSLSAATITGVLNGCKADTKTADWMPAYIPAAQAATLAELCETILPAGKTPGAKDAKVDRFIDVMLKDVYKPEDGEKFKAGLLQLDQDAQAKFGKSFAKITGEQRVEMVKAMDDALRGKAVTPPAKLQMPANTKEDDVIVAVEKPDQKSFYQMAKELTITGYCTSEEGATKLLKYLPVPGEYKACIPFSEVGGTWAL
ncbi:MAG: gluconate 2-dehydrogenase subunit 3 family protein [Saprospiraceae bacterium]